MNCTATPLVTFKDTVHSDRTDVVYHRVRLLLYASGIPTVVAAIEDDHGLPFNIKQVVENMRNRGFTLIEILIAIVIVAILAAIALPAYTSQLRKSSRAEAQSVLTTAAGNEQHNIS
jgi:prepilin-type N-terminal cleavage/methylation domain-containing protein